MTAFYEGKYDVLLSTAIVESGLDLPNANTLIVHRADMFGLAQLYQLRGRVGRSKTRAYAYFTTPPGKSLTEGAEKRLKVLQSLDTLGAGFSLASHDLDIRGAGNLLGRGAVGPHPRGRLRALPVDAGGGGRGHEGRRPRRARPTSGARRSRSAPRCSSRRPTSPTCNSGSASTGACRRSRRAPRSTTSPPSWSTASASCPRRSSTCSTSWRSRACAAQAGIAQVDAGPKGAVIAFRKNEFANPEGLVAFVQSLARARQGAARPQARLQGRLGPAGRAPQGRARAHRRAGRHRRQSQEGGVMRGRQSASHLSQRERS